MSGTIRTVAVAVLGMLMALPGCRRAVVDNPTPPISQAATKATTPEPKQAVDPAPAAVTIDISSRKLDVRDCLLRTKLARREATTALPSEVDRLAALTDNDAGTVALVSATTDAPLELVYSFGGQTVTPLELVVLLPERIPPGSATARVEVLVSMLSPVSGFQFLRADPLEAGDRVQRFRLRPQGARWVMLRFVPATRSRRIAVAEVALLGKVGVPASAYAFKESPVRALDLLASLQAMQGLPITLDADEAKMFADVDQGRFRSGSLAEAALLAGGIRDAAKRKQYLAQIDALAEAAAKEVADLKTPTEKAEKLLRWLHGRSLAKGYVGGQTDLHVVLDQQTYNCVSSAILYVVLAKKLGLEARGVAVPDHAFAIHYEGTRHADVETTTDRGFNPVRDQQALADFQRTTGFVYIPDSNRDLRRELGEAGLAAVVYYNHGVLNLERRRFPEALAAFFRALSLDPEDAQAVHNTLAGLTLWALDLTERGRFDDARAVVSAGLELAPRDAGLGFARTEVWLRHADDELTKKGEDAGLALLRRAAQAVPDGPFQRLQAWVTIRKGETLVKAGKWEEALALVEPALPKIAAEAQKDLREWQAGVFVRWARAELEAGRFEQAIAVLERGLEQFPKDGRFPDLLGSAAQEWARKTEYQDGGKQVGQVLANLQKKHPNQPALKEAAKQMAFWRVIELQEKGRHEEALTALQPGAPLYPGDSEARELLRAVYDNWAWTFMKKQDWQGAFEVYLKALDKYPTDPHLQANLAWVAQQWLIAVEKAKGPGAMRAMMAQLKKDHAKVADFIGISAARVWSGIRELKNAGRFEEALAALDRQKDLLKDPEEVRTMVRILFDDWADHHFKASAEPSAVTIYEQALQRFPDDGHVKNNLAALIQRWALKMQAAGNEAQAKETLLQLLVRFPKVPDVAEVVRNHVPLVVQDLRRAGKYEEALAALTRHRELLQELHGAKAGDEERALARSVYHVWSEEFRDKEEWDKALEVYNQGLKRYPRDGDLLAAAAGVWDRRASKHIDKNEWDKAIAIYDLGLKQFPESGLLKNNREFCVEKKKQGK